MLINNGTKESNTYLEILENENKIIEKLKDINHPKEIRHGFPRNLIPTISDLLEKNKERDWSVELGEYEGLINDFSEKKIYNAKN